MLTTKGIRARGAKVSKDAVMHAIAVLVVMFMVLALGAGNGFAQRKLVMKISHAAPTEDARHRGAMKIKEVVEAEVGDLISVQVYPASQLGADVETLEAMQFGSIEMVILPTAFLGGFQPLIGVFDLFYFLPENVEDLLKLHDSEAVKRVLATTEEVGIKTLGIWHTGYKQPTANRPLRTPEDYRGVKFREMPSPVLMGQLEAVGATPVSMPFSETYSAMQTGAVDGQPGNPVNLIYDMKFHEVQRYVMLANVGTLDQLVMVNKAWYENLPPEVQAAINKGVAEGREVALRHTLEKAEEKLEAMRASGIEIVELTEEERARLREAFSSAWDVYVRLNGERGRQILEEMKAAIEEIRSR